MKVSSLVPIKLNSRRLPNKNFLRLGDHPLAVHIFNTLLSVPELDNVFCYASQPQIMSLLPAGAKFLARPSRLDNDDVKGNELFRYAVERIDADVIVLCHATAPFVSAKTIERAISKIKSGAYDSVVGVKRLKTYCWYKDLPLNYDPRNMVQTQDLDPVYAETSGIYVFKKNDYLDSNCRINGRTYLIELDEREAVDIDYPRDFTLAKMLLDYDPQSSASLKDRFFVNHMNSLARSRSIGLMCFDLDGVLIDSIPVMEKAWQKAMLQSGLTIPFSDYKDQIGYPFQAILNNLRIPSQLQGLVEKTYNEYAMEAQDDIIVYPGIHQALCNLSEAGIPIAVATSKKKERTAAIMASKFADVPIACVLTPEDVHPGRGKPHPDQLLRAALNVGADPADSVYVGDMQVDKSAAIRAGFQFVHAGWGYGSLESTEDVCFNQVEDLVEFFISE